MPRKAVHTIQTFIRDCERHLPLGKLGGNRDMVGKYRHSDIRAKLDMMSMQLEIDMRTLRYVGHKNAGGQVGVQAAIREG